MNYRTKTYIAGDWTGDIDLIGSLYIWNENEKRKLDFINAHDLKSARDTSKPCSIKSSLSDRLNRSKTFILIVGKDTKSLTKGACRYCDRYSCWNSICQNGKYFDNRSFIEYECEKAIKDKMKIIVIYNYMNVNKSLCPTIIKDYGVHISGKKKDGFGKIVFDYQKIKDTIMNYS